MAGHAGSAGSRRRALAPGRSAGASLGIGSRYCSGAPDALGRTDGPRTPRRRCRLTPRISCGGNLRSRRRGSDCVSSRAAIRGPFGAQAPICAAAASPAWRPDGSYLITGGLGDLGLLVARWMVEQGARRLILLGRTKLPPRASWSSAEAGSRLAHQIAAIRELEALGASVHLASVDVADEGQLSAFLDEFRAEGWPPIRGVVHAAGVLQDGLLAQLDTAALESVLRPKMMGGWLLHRLLEDAPLGLLRTFFFRGFASGPAWPGELCCCQRLPGCSGASPKSPGSAGPEHQLGSVERTGLRGYAWWQAPRGAPRALGNQEHRAPASAGSAGTAAPARLDPGRGGAR